MNITIHHAPWTYGVIDNTYPEDYFRKSRDELSVDVPRLTLLNAPRKSPLTVQIDNIKFPETSLLVKSVDLFELFERVKPNFKTIRPYKQLKDTSIVSATSEYPHDIHHETPSKVFSLVTYISPVINRGTFLYDTTKTVSTEVEWAPNRSMFFCGENNVTWHSFFADHQPRITLTRFLIARG